MHYQVGGSLTTDAPSYIERQADTDFVLALQRGEFCTVLNSRQMGKSSLMVRSHQKFCQLGYRCAVLDMTNIGSENITPLQWYKGIVRSLWQSFQLTGQAYFTFKAWWQNEEDISLLQRLSQFIKDVLLAQFPEDRLVIFVDEIDSILSLPFPVDDFFALVRFCYNQRAIDPDYKRIHFAIFGVATPADLIRDRTRTPFNIGTNIILSGFTPAEAQPLAKGLQIQKGDTRAVLKAILSWTNGQPFLTQKLCQLAISSSQDAATQPLTISPGNEAYWVDNLVRKRILDRWESQDEPEHLRTIRNRILSNTDTAGRLLATYQQVLTESVIVTDTRDHVELILSGVVHRSINELSVKNRIYAAVFDLAWVKHQLSQLRPYAQLIEEWLDSNKFDESRLLRGQSLKEAQLWSQAKQLSDQDYQYLAASVESDRKAIQQALEAQRTQAVTAQLRQAEKARKYQQRLIVGISGALLLAVGLGLRAMRSERTALRSEVEALVSSSQGNYAANQRLDAMVDGVKATQILKRLGKSGESLQQPVQEVLRQAIYGAQEYNRLLFNTSAENMVFSPDGSLLAAGMGDGTVDLLQADGTIARQIQAHDTKVSSVAFSPDGSLIASSSADQTFKLWQVKGDLVHTFKEFPFEVRDVEFSPNGQYLAAVSGRQVSLWRTDGTLITIVEDSVAFSFSPDGQWLATAGDQMVQLWQISSSTPSAPTLSSVRKIELSRFSSDAQLASLPPRLQKSKKSPPGRVLIEIAFSPDSQILATTATNQPLQLWQTDGSLISSIEHSFVVNTNIAFTPDSQKVAAVTKEKAVELWSVDGTPVELLQGHQASVESVAIASDGKRVATASSDGAIRFWQWQNPFVQKLTLQNASTIPAASLSADGKTVIAGQPNGDIYFWHRRAAESFSVSPDTQIAKGHPQVVHDAAASLDGKMFASADRAGIINLWSDSGKELHQFDSGSNIWGVALSPDNHQVRRRTRQRRSTPLEKRV